MDEKVGILIAIAIGIVLVATLLFLVIPEPSERAVIASERLDVAVLAFRNSSSWPGVEETLRGRIETKLVNSPGINVFSRTQLDALLIERALATAGLLEPTTAVEIGTLTGVSKLITGTLYAVDTHSSETTVCVAWENGNCSDEVPATQYTARVLAQIEVVDARTGFTERAIDLAESESTTVRSGDVFGGFDTLFASASTEIASTVANALTAAYTRELRYGLYKEVEVKREGFVGKEESNRFSSSDETVHLIIHFTRVRNKDVFDLTWFTPDRTPIGQAEEVVSNHDWLHYQLDLQGLPPGRYVVQGLLNGVSAFEEPFSISP